MHSRMNSMTAGRLENLGLYSHYALDCSVYCAMYDTLFKAGFRLLEWRLTDCSLGLGFYTLLSLFLSLTLEIS